MRAISTLIARVNSPNYTPRMKQILSVEWLRDDDNLI